MRIVFWGSERKCYVTSNMLILACYFACQKGYRICLMELAAEKRGISRCFPGRRKHYAQEYMETLLMYRLYYVPREAWIGASRLRYLETNMDMVFLNLANRTDREARELMHNADLVVVNLKQEWRSFDKFFAEYANLSAKILLLIGNYYEDGCCDKDHLLKKYELESEQLGIIPNNPEYEMACAKGRISRYMRKSNRRFMSAIKSIFLREVGKTAELLYKNIKIAE